MVKARQCGQKCSACLEGFPPCAGDAPTRMGEWVGARGPREGCDGGMGLGCGMEGWMHQHPLGFLCFWFVLLPFFFLYLVLCVSSLLSWGWHCMPGDWMVWDGKGENPTHTKGGLVCLAFWQDLHCSIFSKKNTCSFLFYVSSSMDVGVECSPLVFGAPRTPLFSPSAGIPPWFRQRTLPLTVMVDRYGWTARGPFCPVTNQLHVTSVPCTWTRQEQQVRKEFDRSWLSSHLDSMPCGSSTGTAKNKDD